MQQPLTTRTAWRRRTISLPLLTLPPPPPAGPHTGSPASRSPFGPHVPTKDWCPFHVRYQEALHAAAGEMLAAAGSAAA